jgi:hypothetical protein
MWRHRLLIEFTAGTATVGQNTPRMSDSIEGASGSIHPGCRGLSPEDQLISFSTVKVVPNGAVEAFLPSCHLSRNCRRHRCAPKHSRRRIATSTVFSTRGRRRGQPCTCKRQFGKRGYDLSRATKPRSNRREATYGERRIRMRIRNALKRPIGILDWHFEDTSGLP